MKKKLGKGETDSRRMGFVYPYHYLYVAVINIEQLIAATEIHHFN